MMALEEETEIRPDARMLPRLIEAARDRGDWEHAVKLQGWLDEAKAPRAISPRKLPAQELSEEDYQNADPDETIVTTSLGCYRRDIRFRLFDREVTDPSQLTNWRQRFLPAIGLSAEQIRVVNRFQDSIGFSIGSDVDLLRDVPPKSPFGIDLRDGRLPSDVHDILRRLAQGETTFRDASVELGSGPLARVRPHQRCCSIVQRHAQLYANECRLAFQDQFSGQNWWVECKLREFPRAKPAFGLQVRLATTLAAVKDSLHLCPKPVYGGVSWRGIPMALIEVDDESR